MGGSIEEMPAEGMELMDKGSPEKEGRVQLRRELGVLEGVSVILGIIIGSGIFVSPKGVLEEIGSVGAALLIWVASGFLALIGALCYAELGTAVPKSGGDYAYIREAFAPRQMPSWHSLLPSTYFNHSSPVVRIQKQAFSSWQLLQYVRFIDIYKLLEYEVDHQSARCVHVHQGGSHHHHHHCWNGLSLHG
ncbi:unnamed protein product [Darwinula stevensoni]|uniref:Uncharacterized protein n=1 Tax=Darwinula stevensoni TaxID=69355 RepID=A0A7R9FRY5_9CRUS|nr:unnamed protein product [Darwinula stevensoni]CAG0902672.1 unnamed protein product [Darwinula stevensoni]